MADNADIAVDDVEKESLPAHVAACGRRYETLRKDIRKGREAVDGLRRLVLAVLALSALSLAEQVAPGVKAAALAAVGRAIVGG